ncbi:MAG: putative signal transducing protein [Terriglobia bacterium]
MRKEEESVRVWTGLDLLQAKMIQQMLIDNGIECATDRDLRVIPVGEFGEISLWVGKDDEPRARPLLEEIEKDMSLRLEGSLEESDTEDLG